jgi:thermitase
MFCISLAAGVANAAEYLVRFDRIGQDQTNFTKNHGGKLDLVSKEGVLFKWTTTERSADELPTWDASVAYIQPNFTIKLAPNPSLEAVRTAYKAAMAKSPMADDEPIPGFPGGGGFGGGGYADNPAIKTPGSEKSGADPLIGKQWGLKQIGAPSAWSRSAQGKGVIVAVTDSGVDYNHEDLIANMWRNPGEIPDNGVDDDHNGYVDDVVGWDFAMKDNKPYDMTVDMFSLMFGGGNPGHGTHVSGVIAAKMDNGIGIAGVAPQAQIMALRFITEKGQGTTESAIQAIDYAVKNGAKVINASWGGEKGDEDDSALQDAIKRAESAGVIFCVAAGNGRAGKGYDNDSDSKPTIPSTLSIPNILAVAAIDEKDAMGGFSNWGVRSVKMGAPGVQIMSTVPGDRYQDTVIDIPFLGMTAHWDGTSMATPHVSGALALAWSDHPSYSYAEVIDSLMKASKSISSLSGKVVSGGRLDLPGIR